MTLKNFAIKYKFKIEDLREILSFESLELENMDEEIDDKTLIYLMDYMEKNPKKKFSSRRNNFFKNKKNSEKKEEKIVPIKSMTIQEFIDYSDISCAQIITFFLKEKKLYSIQNIISTKEVLSLCEEFKLKAKEIKIIEKNDFKNNETFSKNKNVENLDAKLPVVVVVGHVDHGKTTLLDTIREASVAKNEKGGITQKISAYITKKNNKEIVFIDTPGHEAFISLRLRGIKVADIAILVVAIDDGVKPQTIESINMIKSMDISPLIAITKIDKVKSEKEREILYNKIYQQLADNNFAVEEWGGNVPVIKISSNEPETIQNLLQTILFMSELMDLKTNFNSKNPYGLILESKVEKGRGSLATVILQEGTLNIGDYFYTKNIYGKASFLIDTCGKEIKKIKASEPFLMGGFSELPSPGSTIYITSQKEAKRMAEENKFKFLNENKDKFLIRENLTKNIIIKSDVFSSMESVINLILKLIGKLDFDPKIISSSVGFINENDVNLALTTNSIIYSFNSKIDPRVESFIKKENIKIKTFDVIYHLIEDVEDFLKNKEVILEFKKIGELLVLKIFDIKNVGIIIGFKVLSGNVKKGNKIAIYRNSKKIGDGSIKSLQKEREFVKELTKGHEGAISIDGFNNLQEGDKIEILSL